MGVGRCADGTRHGSPYPIRADDDVCSLLRDSPVPILQACADDTLPFPNNFAKCGRLPHLRSRRPRGLDQ